MHWTTRHVKQITSFFCICCRSRISALGLIMAELKVILINTEFEPGLLALSLFWGRDKVSKQMLLDYDEN